MGVTTEIDFLFSDHWRFPSDLSWSIRKSEGVQVSVSLSWDDRSILASSFRFFFQNHLGDDLEALAAEVSQLRLSTSQLAIYNMRLRSRLSGSVDLDISECASPCLSLSTSVPSQDVSSFETGDVEELRDKYEELRFRHFYLLCLNVKQEFFAAGKFCNVTADNLYDNFPEHLDESEVFVLWNLYYPEC